MLDRLFQKLYNKLFVTIVVSAKKSRVYIELTSGSRDLKLLESAEQIFDTDTLDTKMREFIDSYLQETPYHYIALIDNSQGQGALPTCDAASFEKFADLRLCESRCVKDGWSYYTHRSDLVNLERRYAPIGVDFIFSPFTILSHFFRDKIENSFALFVLVQANQLTLAVFDKTKLLFASHLDMHRLPEEEGLMSSALEQDLELDLDVGIDLEDIQVDADELELLDDFGDIEDLDTLEEIDEFSEEKDIEEVLNEASTTLSNTMSKQGSEGFNEDYQRFKLIQSAIETYYKDERYESRFIENIYMADSVGVGSDLRRYVEEELFVNVYIRQIDLSIELCSVTKMELRG